MSEFFFKEIKKNKYQLLQINDDLTMNKINFIGYNLYSPFGIEEYNNKFILNLEISKNNDLIKFLRELDNFLININSFKIKDKVINLNNMDYYPILKNRKDKKPIIRTHIKITKKKNKY